MLAVYIYLMFASICFVICAVTYHITDRPMWQWITTLSMGYVFVAAALINLLLETV